MARPLAVVGGVVMAIGLILGACSQGIDNPMPSPSSPQPVVPSVTPSVPAVPSQSPPPAAETPTPTVSPSEAVPSADAVPSWLSIPAIGIDESIAPMGLNARGELEPPPDHTIWYDGSPKPGQNGTSVVAGHVQYGSTPDNFWRLNELPDGSLITITYSDGTVTEWVSVRMFSELKEDLQRNPVLWGPSETPILALVTCDKNSPVRNNHFLNNVVVIAVPT